MDCIRSVVETLDSRRKKHSIEHAEAEKFALEACELAEKARALAREANRKRAIYLSRKQSMMGAENNPWML